MSSTLATTTSSESSPYNSKSTPCLADASSRTLAISWFGYHPTEFDETVLYTRRNVATHFLNGEPPNDLSEPVSPIGQLGKLPLELLSAVVQYADLKSVLLLRLANRRTRLIVDSSVPYKYIVCHIPDVLAALDWSDVAQSFTVDEVYTVFCKRSCEFCGDIGSYLWIPECVRCCFNCIGEAPLLMPLIESDAKTLFGVTKKALTGLPSMLSLPGTYGMVEMYHGRRFRLYSQRRVLKAAIVHHGGQEAYDKWMDTEGRKARLAFTRPARRGVGKLTFYMSARFMSATPMPYYDSATRTLHRGMVCRGCQIAMVRSRHLMVTQAVAMDFIRKQARMWTEEGLFEHLKECKDACDIWGFIHEHRNRPRETMDVNGQIPAPFLQLLINRLWNGPPPL